MRACERPLWSCMPHDLQFIDYFPRFPGYNPRQRKEELP